MRSIFLTLLGACICCAQQFEVSTVAGLYSPGITLDVARDVTLGTPSGIVTDNTGNVYFSCTVNIYGVAAQSYILKLDTNGFLTRIAGNPVAGYSGDGGPAIGAALNGGGGLVMDPAGNLYSADTGNNRIRKITSDGIISTIAGNGTNGNSGDGGPATAAALSAPILLALDSNGNLYVSVLYTVIRKITPDGTISTVAGNGEYGFSGDGGPATSARIGALTGMAVDPQGNLYLSDFTNRGSHIRKVSPDGIITTVVGKSGQGYSGDGGPVAAAQFFRPTALTFDRKGNLYVFDSENWRIRMVNPAGIVTTIAGDGSSSLTLDGVPALSTGSPLVNSMTVDPAGNLYIADYFQVIRKLSEGLITAVAGDGGPVGGGTIPGDGAAATLASLAAPTAVAIDNNGFLYISDTANNAVRMVSGDGRIHTIITQGVNTSGLHYPGGLQFDAAGYLYIADSGFNNVLKRAPSGVTTVVAGSNPFNVSAYSGDGGPATSARLNYPKDIAVDSSGTVYIADTGNNCIRKVTPDGIINTIADGLNLPTGLALDSTGNLYVADTGNFVVRKIATDGAISIVAGTGVAGHSGDGGTATGAQLSNPLGVRLDSAGNLYIADGAWVRLVTPDGAISTVAGTGSLGASGDGGPATDAQLGAWGLAVDKAGNIYVADPWDNTVRLLQPN